MDAEAKVVEVHATKEETAQALYEVIALIEGVVDEPEDVRPVARMAAQKLTEIFNRMDKGGLN